ncbi:hypothetical protein [Burkholderia sp. Bp9140]|uniref:hypothetical protein n=1 Tax=Burkholderia sp. Bp9140 TaxID=2184572 RepID=UPI0021AB7E29|nr:hypothetical protein [Burkholderia sp. Bp9140]
MKHRNDIRFATTGPALRRAGRMRARPMHAGIAPVARAATASCVVARRSLSLRFVMQRAAAPVAIAPAVAALPAGHPAMAAAAATLACALAAAPPPSRMRGQRPPCRRPRGADRFLLFASP